MEPMSIETRVGKCEPQSGGFLLLRRKSPNREKKILTGLEVKFSPDLENCLY